MRCILKRCCKPLHLPRLCIPSLSRRSLSSSLAPNIYAFKLDDWVYTYENALDILLKLFETNSLKGFGLEEERLSIIAAGAAIQYLKDTEHHNLGHITKLTLADEQYVWLDRFTVRNLELILFAAPRRKTLLDILDHTTCPWARG